MTRYTYAFALLAVAMALVVAGCGGGGHTGPEESGGAYGTTSSSGGTSTGEKTTANAESGSTEMGGAEEGAVELEGGEAANVSLGHAGGLGMVLVNSEGFVLYDFHKDKGGKPTCYGACAEAWPPLLTEGTPMPGNGASASMLGTVPREDGTTQVTYAGHPLYGFTGDTKPGEANGNDTKAFGGEWYALMGNGEEPKD